MIQSIFFSSRSRMVWRCALLALVLAVTYLALAPAPPKSLGTSWDKLNHLMAFSALAFCAYWTVSHWRARWLALPLTLLAYGAAIELLQLQIPGRDGEWADLFADAVGITMGLGLAAALSGLMKKN